MPENTNYGQQLFRDRGHIGKGRQVRQLSKFEPLKFDNFKSGLVASDSNEDIPDSSSPDMPDMEVNTQDALVKAPGTVRYEVLAHAADQMALNVGLTFQAELVLFAAPWIGFKYAASTVWVNDPSISYSTTDAYAWSTYGDHFIFGNLVGNVKSHLFGSDLITDEPNIPQGVTFATIVARLFVGGAVIAGNFEPMGIAWSGVDGYNFFDYVSDQGSGFELLISEQDSGDAVVSIKALGLDVAAILCRHSVWIGRATRDLDRPLDFQPRVKGKGCVAKTTAQTVYGGVMYLSDDGVEFFDGNNSVKVSQAIDPLLLPLDLSKIRQYNSSYNATKQQYMLFTPTATFVFDLQTQRWYMRTLVALGGALFAYDQPDLTWEDLSTPWDSQPDSWANLSGGSSAPVMTLLGDESVVGRALHQEDLTSYKHFGFNFVPSWESKSGDGPTSDSVITVNTISVKYKGEGSVNFFLPNIDADFELVNVTPKVLASAVRTKLAKFKNMHSGMGVGVRVDYVSGTPEISALELMAKVRGPRLNVAAQSSPQSNF